MYPVALAVAAVGHLPVGVRLAGAQTLQHSGADLSCTSIHFNINSFELS